MDEGQSSHQGRGGRSAGSDVLNVAPSEVESTDPTSDGSAHNSGGGTTGPPQSSDSPPSGRPRPVLVVVSLAAVALAGAAFLLIGGRGSGSGGVATPVPPARVSSSGVLASRSATADFHPRGGEPASDILAALPVPADSRATALVDHDRGSGAYDRSVEYATATSYNQLVSFYPRRLAAEGWRVQAQVMSSDRSSRRILAIRPSSDGFYWEAGITVHRPVPGAASTGFEIRLFEITDQ